MTPIAALDAFYAWERQQKPRWKSTIAAIIACIVSSLILGLSELVFSGGLPADFMIKLGGISALVLVTSFFAGLAAEWITKREQEAGA